MPSLAEARKLHGEKKWAESIAEYKAFIDAGLVVSHEQKTNVFAAIGHACEGELNDKNAAFEWYTKAIELRTRTIYHAVAHNNRGNIYRGRKEYALAIAGYTQAIALHTTPDTRANSYWNRSTCFRDLQQFGLELSDLQNAISRGTDTAWMQQYTARLKELRECVQK